MQKMVVIEKKTIHTNFKKIKPAYPEIDRLFVIKY